MGLFTSPDQKRMNLLSVCNSMMDQVDMVKNRQRDIDKRLEHIPMLVSLSEQLVKAARGYGDSGIIRSAEIVNVLSLKLARGDGTLKRKLDEGIVNKINGELAIGIYGKINH